MIDRATFFESVYDALAHLYDRACLATHPLGRYLSRDGSPLPPDQVRRLLLQAVEQLQPYTGAPTTSPSWREHRYLDLRYVEGISHEMIAQQLGLSLRQAHRVRLGALDAVAAKLWEKYGDGARGGRGVGRRVAPSPPRPVAPSQNAPSPRLPVAKRPVARSARPALDDELARHARNPADSPAELVEEIRGALETVRPLASRRGVVVELQASPVSVLVTVGRTLLRQMVVILLSHALERQTGDHLSVAIDSGGEEAVLAVVFSTSADAGGTPSVPECDAEEPFAGAQRLETVRRLAEVQGGSLDARPVPGGTCLHLKLPLDRAATVLVIDDNPDLAHLFEAYLQGGRYRVIHAKTARQALRLADQARPDIITLDVMMPFQDGWEVFRQLRDSPTTRTIPIVVCSILPEEDLALSLGADGFLAKPVTPETLVAILDQCLEPR